MFVKESRGSVDVRAAWFRVRAAALVVHRWVGLATSAFLIIAGLTGTMMAFYHDLDPILNPDLYLSEPPVDGAPLLDPVALRDRIREELPGSEVSGVILDLEPGRAVNYWIDDQETFVDPYTGAIQGQRVFGSPWGGRWTILTFFYRCHFSLALDDVGTLLFGVVAVLWTVDCFVGAFLTFPPPSASGAGSWLRRWLPAWLVKTSSLFAGVFTWHRASGLWVWAVCLVFAWSAVALNLGDPVYRPVMDVVLPGPEELDEVHLDPPRTDPALGTREALELGRRLLAAEADRRGVRVIDEKWLSYEPEHGTYTLTVESTLDVDARFSETSVVYDGDDGHLVAFHAPTGQDTRSTVDAWLVALHFGAVRQGGYAYRTFVAAFGVLVAVLAATGVWIWWKKPSRAAPRTAG